MEAIVNIRNFSKRLAYYLKIGIFINKGTENDDILNRCISLCNTYMGIVSAINITDEQETFVRKSIKRINLIFKLDENNNPVDIRKKEFQSKMIHLKEHDSLAKNDLTSMIEYASNNNITMFPGIPLIFILRKSKYQRLLWQYTRSIFYLTQLFLSHFDSNANYEDPNIIIKSKIYDESSIQLENILTDIAQIEEDISVNKLMNADKFLSSKLGAIDKHKINDAVGEVKKILIKKGMKENNSMTTIIDSIGGQIGSVDMSQGNILQNMFDIARTVADEMRSDLANNPDSLGTTLGTITEIFSEAINNSSEEMPAELKNIFNIVSSFKGENGQPNPNVSEEEIAKQLDMIISSNGLNKEDFLSSISSDGQIDKTKLENILSTLNPLTD